ncbi:hypothetical protein [Actinomadura gamaensis]|uniref:Uncharacterized protein n=1 Tax=Actinomadura gamaensis TaxID=1763541 RepID=A0ABV9TS00_9ACTN
MPQVAGAGQVAPQLRGEQEPPVGMGEACGEDQSGHALRVKDGDRLAERVTRDGEGLHTLLYGGGDQLIGQAIQGKRGFCARGAAGAGVVGPDDGVLGGQGVQDRAVVGVDAAAGAVGGSRPGPVPCITRPRPELGRAVDMRCFSTSVMSNDSAGEAKRSIADLYPGEAKTDARDADPTPPLDEDIGGTPATMTRRPPPSFEHPW